MDREDILDKIRNIEATVEGDLPSIYLLQVPEYRFESCPDYSCFLIMRMMEPRGSTSVWHYNGGTHLYEYDRNEMVEILTRNFPESEITALGLMEYQLPNGQWGTDITYDLDSCWVFFCVINLKK